MARVKIKGLKETLKKLDDLGKDLDPQINGVLELTAGEIEREAKRRAPKNVGRLAGSINKVKLANLVWGVNVSAPYAPYVEFGTAGWEGNTGNLSIPAELKEDAQRARNRSTGSFEQGLDNIRRWCRQRGIDPESANAIFWSILNNGTRARPFLWPAFRNNRNKLVEGLQDLLDEETRKI